MSTSISTILSRKGWGVTTVLPEDTLLAVVDTLTSNHIGAVVVQDRSGQLLGLLSEREVVRGLSEHHDEVTELTAADLMSLDVPTLTGDASVTQAMQLMTLHRHRHIPICENGKLVGMLSIGDVVKHRLEESDFAIEEMRAYVMQCDPDHSSAGPRYATR